MVTLLPFSADLLLEMASKKSFFLNIPTSKKYVFLQKKEIKGAPLKLINLFQERKTNKNKTLLFEFYKSLVESYGINMTKTKTFANLSTRLLHKFSPTPHWPQTKSHHLKIIANSFRGGNTWQKKFWGKRLYFYDVNSLYPFCFINKLPKGNPTIIYNPSSLKGLFGFIEAKIIPPNFITYNIIALNQTKNISNGVYFSEELKYLQKLNYIVILKKAYIYKHTHNITQDFLLHLYSKKKIFPKLIKFLLNASYGKLTFRRTLSPLLPLAAAITSYARIYMHKSAMLTPNPPLYSDIDSLIVQHSKISGFTHAQKLGFFKNQITHTHTHINKAFFYKPRIYNITHNITHIVKGNITHNITPALKHSKLITINEKQIATIWINSI